MHRPHAFFAMLMPLTLWITVTGAQADGGHFYDAPRYVPHLPHDHRIVVHGGVNFYYGGGWWYRPYGPHYVVVRPPIGVYIDALPLGYETVVVAGTTYFLLNEVYYRRDGDRYVVVEAPDAAPAPPAAATPPAGDKVFVYPKNNQSSEQQAKDRYECHHWAVQQTGYDPTLPLGGVAESQSLAKRSEYQRAMSACLNGRGYSLN